jgi:flagellar basal-body rod modification protein FlgD
MLLSGLTASPNLDPDSKSGAAQARLNEDLNRFLNLLVTQLQHQDPLDPMDANEFTSQLVQFASVEQQIYSNANLERLVSLQEASQTASMVDYLGKKIESRGNAFNLENDQATFSYTLGTKADEVTITIRNSDGRIVFTTGGEPETGYHSYTWDGKDAFGIAQPDGSYTATVSALDVRGKLLNVEQTVTGRVTAASTVDGAPILFMGDVSVYMDEVITVATLDD